jgi:hypothetical protein
MPAEDLVTLRPGNFNLKFLESSARNRAIYYSEAAVVGSSEVFTALRGLFIGGGRISGEAMQHSGRSNRSVSDGTFL